MIGAVTIRWPVWPVTSVGANAGLVAVLATVAGACLYRLAGRRSRRLGVSRRGDLVSLLAGGFISAWPAYWLVLYLAIFGSPFAWVALITAAATMGLLPLLAAGVTRADVAFVKVNAILAAFLLLAGIMLLGAGFGIDREFSRLDGHFIVTTFLLCLWWGWYDRGRSPADAVAGEGDGTGLRTGWVVDVVCLIVYHVCAFALLAATRTFAETLNLAPGLVLGLILGVCWTPGAVRQLAGSSEAASALVARILALIYLSAGAVLIRGAVVFPFTVWQMEVVLLIVTAVLYLGMSWTGQALKPFERFLLALTYVIYLSLRIYRLFF